MVLARFVVQALCKGSGIGNLVCKGARGQASGRGVRPVVIVLLSPELDPVAGVSHWQEPGSIEALRAQESVEGLDIGVVGWLSRTRELALDAVEISPLIEQATGKFRPVIAPKAARSDGSVAIPSRIFEVDDVESLERTAFAATSLGARLSRYLAHPRESAAGKESGFKGQATLKRPDGRSRALAAVHMP